MFVVPPAVLAAFSVLAAPVAVDLDTLDEGAPPALSWYADGTIHTGTTEYALGDRSPASFAEVSGGYAVHAWNGGADDELFLADGTDELLLATAPGDTNEIFGPVLSADGTRMAWSVAYELDGIQGARRTELVVADAATGQTLDSHTVPDDDLRPRGFIGDTVVLDRGTEAGVLSWRPDTGDLTEWERADGVTAVSDRQRLAAVVDSENPDCTGIRSPNQVEDLWQVCDETVIGFDPRGRYAVTRQDVDADTVVVGVTDARTGERLLRLETGGGTPEVAWESPEEFLLTAWDDGRMAIVRCTTGGDCELATEARSTSGGWPYLLPTQ